MSYTDTPRLALKKADAGTNQAFETTVFNANLDKIDAESVAVDARFDVIEANNWVTNARLADNSVGSAELQANSVGSSQIQFAAVGSDEIAANAVTADKIPDASIGGGKISADAIGSSHLQSNSVGSSEIQPNAVTVGKITANAIVGPELAPYSVGGYAIANGAIYTDKLQNGAVTSVKLDSTLDLTGKAVTVATQTVGDYSSKAASTVFAWDVAALANENDAANRNTPTKFANGVTPSTVPTSGLITIDISSFGFTSAPIVTGNIFGATTAKLILTLDTVTTSQIKFKVWTSTFGNSTTATVIHWQAVGG
jgi:hypothetical protein